MPGYHTVQQGEHLPGIAQEYGFDYPVIWNHAENSQLKSKRKTPAILYPGDSVFIPDRETREESCATDQLHRFERQKAPLELRVTLKRSDDTPRANLECTLVLDGAVEKIVTDANGSLKKVISETARNATLTVQDPVDSADFELPIYIGHLDPIEEESGVKARLNNLGYWPGNVEDNDPLAFQSAIEEFQCDYGLMVDGIVGPVTRAKLKQVHGC